MCVCVFVRIRVVKVVTVLTQSLINKSLFSYWAHYGLSCSGSVSSGLKEGFLAKNIASASGALQRLHSCCDSNTNKTVDGVCKVFTVQCLSDEAQGIVNEFIYLLTPVSCLSPLFIFGVLFRGSHIRYVDQIVSNFKATLRNVLDRILQINK